MYTPLGAGDVDIAGIVTALRTNGFDGWFVMEQDTILDGEPADEGPVRDVRASVAFMQRRLPRASRHEPADRRARGIPHRRVAIVGPAQELGHRLVAVAARDPLRAEAFAEKHGVERVLASYDDVINDPEVDVVYNPLANSLHAPWNLAAVAAGKPVLTEKPFARNRAEAQRVAEAADAAGITVMEGFHYLFHPVTRRALELAGDGTLGDLVACRGADGDARAGSRRSAVVTRPGRRRADGPGLLRPARHAPARASVGRPRARQGAQPGRRRMVRCRARLPGGATGLSANSMVADDYSFTLRIVGTKGDVLVHNFIKPQEDDRLTDPHTGGHHGRAPRHPRRRTPISWRRSPTMSCTARRYR